MSPAHIIDWNTWGKVGVPPYALSHSASETTGISTLRSSEDRLPPIDVAPHPDAVTIVPAGGSNSEVGGGKLTG